MKKKVGIKGTKYLLPKIPNRNKISHKNNYGRFLVWATSVGTVGCGYFVCRAIYLAGGGYAKLLIPYENYPILSVLTPETVFFVYKNELEKEEIIKRELPNCDYLICGPGIGISDINITLIKYIIDNFNKPAVLDADAIKLLISCKERLKTTKSKIIITPHEGEFSYLTDIPIEQTRNNRAQLAINFAKIYNITCVLKGYNTIVTDGKQTYINKTGGPQLAKAGTGDVLTGIIGGFLGLKLSPFDAACLGVHIHGAASDIVKREYSEHSLIPENLLRTLPLALKKYMQK